MSESWTIGYGPKGITGPTAAYTFEGAGKYELVTTLDTTLPDGCHRVVCLVPRARDKKQAESLRLIAVAPQLLEALKAMVSYARAEGKGLRIADEVIAAATGEPVAV